MKVFENAKRPETREAFMASRAKTAKYTASKYADMEKYILSEDCVRDLERLEQGDFFLDYLMKLIVYSMTGLDRIYSDRLFSFRSDRTGPPRSPKSSSMPDTAKAAVKRTDKKQRTERDGGKTEK